MSPLAGSVVVVGAAVVGATVDGGAMVAGGSVGAAEPFPDEPQPAVAVVAVRIAARRKAVRTGADATVGRLAYGVLVGLHVACAVIAFGSLALTGAYGIVARGGSGQEEAARWFAGRNRAKWLLLPVPFFGVAALLEGHGGRSHLGDVWVVGGALVWLVAVGLLVLVVSPAERSLRRDAADGKQATRLATACALADVLFVIALGLMVTQPS